MGSDEYEAGVCGGNWWNSSTSLFGSSLCASSLHHDHPIAWHRKSKSSTSLDSLLPHTIIHENHEGSTSYPSILQEDLNSSGVDCSEIKTQDSSFVKPANQDFANTNSSAVSSFQMNSCLTNYPSTLFDNDHPLPPQQQMNFPSSLNYMGGFSPLLRPCLPKQSLISNWNSSANSLNSIRGHLLPSMSSQLPFNEKSTVPSAITKVKVEQVNSDCVIGRQRIHTCSIARVLNVLQNFQSKVDEFQESRSKSAALKRARMETPSPFPTFKVRKEKLGDRITALQQMVSPFGKTDTASVLHEANEYIKFLHDQVKVLSTPYLRSRVQHQQGSVKEEGPKQDLRSRGMCLVPISTTFPVTSTDFWTPTFT